MLARISFMSWTRPLNDNLGGDPAQGDLRPLKSMVRGLRPSGGLPPDQKLVAMRPQCEADHDEAHKASGLARVPLVVTASEAFGPAIVAEPLNPAGMAQQPILN